MRRRGVVVFYDDFSRWGLLEERSQGEETTARDIDIGGSARRR